MCFRGLGRMGIPGFFLLFFAFELCFALIAGLAGWNWNWNWKSRMGDCIVCLLLVLVALVFM